MKNFVIGVLVTLLGVVAAQHFDVIQSTVTQLASQLH